MPQYESEYALFGKVKAPEAAGTPDSEVKEDCSEGTMQRPCGVGLGSGSGSDEEAGSGSEGEEGEAGGGSNGRCDPAPSPCGTGTVRLGCCMFAPRRR